MIWNTIPDEERLLLWKNLRDEITNSQIDTQLTRIAEFCAYMPIGSRTIDYYSPKDWPTPWEILFHGSFCTSSISLLIFYTLILLPTKVDIELILVEDDRDVYLLPLIDNQFVLNYHLGQVSKHSDIKDNLKVLKKYARDSVRII